MFRLWELNYAENSVQISKGHLYYFNDVLCCLVAGGDGRRLHPRRGVDDDSSPAQWWRHTRAQPGVFSVTYRHTQQCPLSYNPSYDLPSLSKVRDGPRTISERIGSHILAKMFSSRYFYLVAICMHALSSYLTEARIIRTCILFMFLLQTIT